MLSEVMTTPDASKLPRDEEAGPTKAEVAIELSNPKVQEILGFNLQSMDNKAQVSAMVNELYFVTKDDEPTQPSKNSSEERKEPEKSVLSMVDLATRALKCDAEGTEGIEVSVIKKGGVVQPFPKGESREFGHESGGKGETTESVLFVSA